MVFIIIVFILFTGLCLREFWPHYPTVWSVLGSFILSALLSFVITFLVTVVWNLIIIALPHENFEAIPAKTTEYHITTLPNTTNTYIANANRDNELAYFVTCDNNKTFTVPISRTTVTTGPNNTLTVTERTYKSWILRCLFLSVFNNTYEIQTVNPNINYEYVINNVTDWSD